MRIADCPNSTMALAAVLGYSICKHMDKKPTQFDFWYAVNNTEVVLAPRRHLETFGNTLINYHMVSELMDNVGQVRVR
jgi:hypothetical protein